MIRLFRVFFPTSILALLFAEIVLTICCFLFAGLVTIETDPTVFFLIEGGLMNISIVTFAILMTNYFQDLYNHLEIRSRVLLAQQVILSIGVAFLVLSALNYLHTTMFFLPRWLLLFGSLLLLVLMPLWRMLYTNVVENAIGARRVLFLGSSPVMKQIYNKLASTPAMGFRPMGFVTDDQSLSDNYPRLSLMEGFADAVESQKPERIIVGLEERRRKLPVEDLLRLRFAGVEIEDAGRAYEATFGRIAVSELHPADLIFAHENGPKPFFRSMQTIYSFLLALIGLILAAPIMLLTAIAVKLTSPGPVLYSQIRTGLHGEPFPIFKFRSMRQDAEAKSGAVWATANDPRVTPIGQWLRKLRLDELPQLFNVLRGEMAIVGPRPERPEFVRTLAEKIPYYNERHNVKPGITGWAQINHKYGDTLEDTIIKLEYDLYYIKHLAPTLDCYIMFNTFKVMLLVRGGQ
jgi:sugar transferase (PEP-CTERM system associated)